MERLTSKDNGDIAIDSRLYRSPFHKLEGIPSLVIHCGGVKVLRKASVMILTTMLYTAWNLYTMVEYVSLLPTTLARAEQACVICGMATILYILRGPM